MLALQELERLEQHKQRLQQLQQEQAAAVERLGGALEAVKGDVLGELARERLQLAQVRRILCPRALVWGVLLGSLQDVDTLYRPTCTVSLEAAVLPSGSEWHCTAVCNLHSVHA